MTQPQAPSPQPTVVNLPPATMPLVTRVWARSPLVEDKKDDSTKWVMWGFGQAHPLMPHYRIMRMYVVPGGAVEIYSVNVGADGKPGADPPTRHTIPWHDVHFIEEAMDVDTFVAEINEAESDEEDEEEDEGGDEGDSPALPALVPLPAAAAGSTPVNGTGGTS